MATSAASTVPGDDLVAVFREVQGPNRCNNWGPKLQGACEKFWTLLGTEHDVSEAAVTSFIHLLLQQDNLALARLVIPDLRAGGQVRMETKLKQRIMDSLLGVRAELAGYETTEQADFDQDFVKAEKAVFHDIELWRASLLLSGKGDAAVGLADEKEVERIRAWLAAYPKS